MVKIFKGGKINEKDCVDDFIVGFDFGVGRVPLVASWRWPWRPWWRPLLEGKMRELLGNFLFSMREIFQRKSFWFILVTLLFGACAYPPFRLMTEAGLTAKPKWDFVLTTLPTPYEVPEIDLEMLLIEAIIAIPLAIAISLVFYSMKTALRQIDDKRLKQHYLNRRL